MMFSYYNEFDPFAAQWLRELIKCGLNGYLRAGYLKKLSDGDSWVNPNGVLMCNAENAEIELFRPWED